MEVNHAIGQAQCFALVINSLNHTHAGLRHDQPSNKYLHACRPFMSHPKWCLCATQKIFCSAQTPVLVTLVDVILQLLILTSLYNRVSSSCTFFNSMSLYFCLIYHCAPEKKSTSTPCVI